MSGLPTPSQRYVGAPTPFGVIVSIEALLYNPQATVKAKDGSVSLYRLPFLVAHGVRPVTA